MLATWIVCMRERGRRRMRDRGHKCGSGAWVRQESVRGQVSLLSADAAWCPPSARVLVLVLVLFSSAALSYSKDLRLHLKICLPWVRGSARCVLPSIVRVADSFLSMCDYLRGEWRMPPCFQRGQQPSCVQSLPAAALSRNLEISVAPSRSSAQCSPLPVL